MNYWDTSCVLKLYTPEPDSETYLALAGQTREPLVASEILTTELYAAFCQKELRGNLKRGSADRLRQRFEADCADGRWLLLPIGHEVLTEAVRLTKSCYQHRPPIPLRTLDSIHLASALSARAASLVTADVRMRQAAVILGLTVVRSDPPRPA